MRSRIPAAGAPAKDPVERSIWLYIKLKGISRAISQMKPSPKELSGGADQIFTDLWIDLRKRCSRQAAEAAGAVWGGTTFQVTLMPLNPDQDL